MCEKMSQEVCSKCLYLNKIWLEMRKMLIQFNFSNFKSYRNEASLDMIAASSELPLPYGRGFLLHSGPNGPAPQA